MQTLESYTTQAPAQEELPDIFESEAGQIRILEREHEGSILLEITPDLADTADLDDAALLVQQSFERVRHTVESLSISNSPDGSDELARFVYVYLNLGKDRLSPHSPLMRTLERLRVQEETEHIDEPELRWIYHDAVNERAAQTIEQILTGASATDRLLPIQGKDATSEFYSEVDRMNEVVHDLQIF